MARKYLLDSPEPPPKTRKRVSLSKKAATSKAGLELINLLFDITLDGDITAEEVSRLYEWLNDQSEDLPAFAYLREQIEEIAADGVITPAEFLDLYISIEKVLPPDLRAEAENRRLVAGILFTPTPAPAWAGDPITEKQVSFLKSLGADPRKFKTKGEASIEIDRLLNGRDSVSNRQMMVLRFWDCVRIADGGKTAVIEHMDAFYAQDSDYLAAWNLWKEENDDRGRQDNPEKVKIGIGRIYLARVKAGNRSSSGLAGRLLFWLIMAGLAFFVFLAIFHR